MLDDEKRFLEFKKVYPKTSNVDLCAKFGFDFERLFPSEALEKAIKDMEMEKGAQKAKSEAEFQALKSYRLRLRTKALQVLDNSLHSADEAIALSAAKELSKYNTVYESKLGERDAEKESMEDITQPVYPNVK